MKNIKLNVLAGLLLASSAAFGGIAGSPHDLSGNTGVMSGSATTADNGEICVYCHTPHAGNATFAAGGNAPLWNKLPDAAGSKTSFPMYGQTIAGTAAATEVANPSLACLSCHDGVSSIDSMVNAPGSGAAAGASLVARLITAVGTNGNANIGQIATGGLAKTHPISIPYNGTDGLTDAAEAGSPASLRPKTALLATGSGSAWIGGTTIQDVLRGADMIECGSCHDPHNGSALTVEARAIEVNFLRHTNTGSQLCLGCHDK